MGFSESVKAAVLKKAHSVCCLCKSFGAQVRQIVPQSKGGSDTQENAIALCESCYEAYGKNEQKRNFLREARDTWNEICERQSAAAKERLDEIKQQIDNSVSYEEFQKLKKELFCCLDIQLKTPRTQEEISAAIEEFLDKIWYGRHQQLKEEIHEGTASVDPGVWKQAEQAARKVEAKYSKSELGPYEDFDWGMISGKLSALRWVMGDDWDSLDT